MQTATRKYGWAELPMLVGGHIRTSCTQMPGIELQHLRSSLLGFGLALISSFLPKLLFLLSGIGMPVTVY